MRHLLWTMAATVLVFPLASHGQEKIGGKDPPGFVKPPLRVIGPNFKNLNGRTLVFCANGSGDSTELTENLREVVREAHAPACVHHVAWCRLGEARLDHNDHEAQLKAAHRLATLVMLIKKDAPAARIIFMGHSAGTRVALAAAGQLPPFTLERIFLFSSSVSRTYDLVPALRASRGGIDSYYNTEDEVLGVAEEEVGTADGLRQPTAGRLGFCVPKFTPAKGKPPSPDALAYMNLRQVRWNESMGDGCAHSFWIQDKYLRVAIVPQLFIVPVNPFPRPPARPQAPPPARR